jgi:Outer membrane protein beta-barrel domain
LLALAATRVLGIGAARAAGENEWQLAGRLGAQTVNVDGRKPWGPTLAVDVAYGLNDAWAVRATLEASSHSVSPENPQDSRPVGNVNRQAALVGLTYTIDVLRLVPYVDLDVGVVHIGGAVLQPQTLLAMQLGVGADWFVNRLWTVGMGFRYLFEPADLLSDPLNLGTNPFAFSITARAGRVF